MDILQGSEFWEGYKFVAFLDMKAKASSFIFSFIFPLLCALTLKKREPYIHSHFALDKRESKLRFGPS